MTPTEVLIGARKLCEERWGQGIGCRAPAGGYCVLTATHASKGGDARIDVDADEFLRKAIGLRDSETLHDWNDHPSRTLADVLAAFDRAIEMSREAM